MKQLSFEKADFSKVVIDSDYGEYLTCEADDNPERYFAG